MMAGEDVVVLLDMMGVWLYPVTESAEFTRL